MEKFIFEEPKCFIEAKKREREINDESCCSEELVKLLLLIFREPDAVFEARWRWLARNKDEISFISVNTEDVGYEITDVVRVYDREYNCVWEFNGGWKAKKYVRRKMKRFGIPEELLC